MKLEFVVWFPGTYYISIDNYNSSNAKWMGVIEGTSIFTNHNNSTAIRKCNESTCFYISPDFDT